MKRILFSILLIGIILLSGCVSLNVTQEVDLTPNNKLIISTKVSGDSEIRQINDAVKEINCKFDIKETKKDTSTYLTYTSQNCLLSGAKIQTVGKNKYKYSLDASYFEKFSASITDATYIIKIKGNVLDTNGINVGNNQVKFLISSEDIENRYVYYVEYTLNCEYDSDCSFDESCTNSECAKLNCGYCRYIENHKCKAYDCCADEDCKDAEKCENHNCIEIQCEYNQHAENHVCVWNCIDSSDCEQNEACKDHNCYELKCAEKEGFFNHSCRLLECKDDEYIENHRCELLKCKDNEVAKNHQCTKFTCNFFQKPFNHKCVNNPLTINLTVVIPLLILGSIVIFLKLKHKKKHKKKKSGKKEEGK